MAELLIGGVFFVTVLFRSWPIWPNSRLSPMFQGVQVSQFRRMAGITIDWLACLAIVKGFKLEGAFTVLIFFFAEVSILIALTGASFGHRLVRIKVVRFADGGAPTPLQALIRTLLLCTVIFAITFDENGRGIHERLSGTYLVRS